MSISTLTTKDTYAGNASISTAYPVTFKYLSSDHVTVYADSVDITDTCTFAGDGTTGTGDFTTAAYAPTTTITVVLDVPLDQPVVLEELGSLPAKTIEIEGFDRLNMQVRRVWRKLGDVITFSNDEGGTGSTGTADNLLGFDGSGDLAEIPNTTFLQTANDLSEVTAATARTNLGLGTAATTAATDYVLNSEVDQDIKTLNLPANTVIGTFGADLVSSSTRGTAVSKLDIPLSELGDITITNPVSGEILEWNGSAWVNTVSGATVTSLDTAPVSPDAGDLWFDTTTTQMYVYYNDGSSSQWVTVTAGSPSTDASSVTYTPAGTGAVATDLQTKARESVSVKDFGAVGDGVADDTAEIQAAIDSVTAAGGGTIYFPAGTYNVNGATGIDVETGVNLKGDGMGKTIIKNVADNWLYIFGCRGGDDVGFENLTIDGDWSTREPVALATDAKRGEGIIFWNGTANLDRLRILNVEVKNTGHYGIGLQNVNIISGIISNVYFENIGGDCIDIKSISSPLSGKALIIDGVFTQDGCGHNNTGYPENGHNNQAVVDVGGKVVLSNVFISGLDSYGTGADEQLGNVGVRFRAPVTAQNRLGSAGSVGSNIYVSSDKLDAEGSLTSKRIIGIAINDADVSVTNAYVENCYWGIRIYNTENGLPYRVSVTNATVKNCLGSTTDGIGFEAVAASKNCVVDVIAEGCDTGAKINGTGHRARLTLDTNTTGLDVVNDALRQSNFDTKFIGNTTDSTNSYVDDETGLVVAKDLKVAALRTPDIELLALADDGSWTSPDDRYMGRLRFLTADTSGSGAIARAQVAAKMNGDSGSGTFIEIGIDAGSGLVQGLLVLVDRVQSKLPHQLQSYTVSTLPAQITGAMIYVTDETGGAVTAFSDGTNWRRTADRVIVS